MVIRISISSNFLFARFYAVRLIRRIPRQDRFAMLSGHEWNIFSVVDSFSSGEDSVPENLIFWILKYYTIFYFFCKWIYYDWSMDFL